MKAENTAKEQKINWWKSGVIYQIYPRSFYDSNNDGIGDINGITMKLDYLSDLGIDAVWLSPVYKSPMHDFGYDISDYCEIDPVFGSMEDFDNLIFEAHKRGIKITMDLVMNHTSHIHPWFIESSSSRDNLKQDWYIWHDGEKGRAPNNWLSIFGGPGWEWNNERRQYYFHSFVKEQPDVNWRSDRLRQAMLNMIEFWLEKGVDGFRLDVCNFFFKDEMFRNNPFGIDGPYPRPYDLQRHIFDRNRPETHDFLKQMRKFLDSYGDIMTVGEVCVSELSGNQALAASFYGNGEDELNLVFDFSHMNKTWDAKVFFNRLKNWNDLIPEKAWPCHVLNNHDQPRSISRYGKGKGPDKRARVAAVMILTSRGTPFIYNGEELGMKNGKIPRKRLVDPIGKKYWPFVKGRDPERTPMQWSTAENAGFSKVEPWLPVNSDYKKLNIENSLKDDKSILCFYKQLIAMRKMHKALQLGVWIPVIDGRDDIIAYIRKYDNEMLLIVLNFSGKNKKVNIEFNESMKVIFSTHRGINERICKGECLISPYEATIFK